MLDQAWKRVACLAIVAALVPLSGCAAKTDGGASGPTSNVTMKQTAFMPQNLTVKVGTTVVWKNLDTVYHTVTSDNTTGPLQSPNIQTGQTFQFKFEAPGTYSYHCKPHSGKLGETYTGMTGTVIVTA